MIVSQRRSAITGMLLLLIVGGTLRIIHLFQTGFVPDEEITWFAAHGIKEHFLPILPSGIIYDRGIPYSYLAWFAGLFFGQTIVSYRIISFISGLAAIIFAFLLGRKTGNDQIGLISAAFVALAPWAILISEWARFYSLFLTVVLLTCLVYFNQRKIAYLLFLAIACLLHESGIILGLLPLFHFIILKRKELVKLTTVAFATIILLFVGKTLLIASVARDKYLNLYEERVWNFGPLTHLEPRNFPAVVAVLVFAIIFVWLLNRKDSKVPLWWAAVVAICASILQLGIVLILYAFSLLLDPSRKKIYTIFTVALLAISALIWVFQTSIHFGIYSFSERFLSIFSYGLAFPLNSVRYFVTHWPILSILALLAVVFISNSSSLREVTVLFGCIALAGVVLIGSVQVPMQPRYFLLASIFAFFVVSIATIGWKPKFGWILACFFLFAVLSEQYFALEESVLLHFEPGPFRPTKMELRAFQIEDEQQLMKLIQTSDIIVSNDELASLYFLGRCDYWILPKSRYSQRFQFVAGNSLRGWYGGSQILASFQEFKASVHEPSNKRFLLILFNTGKFGGNRNEILQDFRNTFKNSLPLFSSRSESILILRFDS